MAVAAVERMQAPCVSSWACACMLASIRVPAHFWAQNPRCAATLTQMSNKLLLLPTLARIQWWVGGKNEFPFQLLNRV